ncbi:MAG: hypothetical protein ACR2JB_29805 [Bryobacteraceae bacterium]
MTDAQYGYARSRDSRRDDINSSRITDLRDDMSGRFGDISRHIDNKFALLSPADEGHGREPYAHLGRPPDADPETGAAG